MEFEPNFNNFNSKDNESPKLIDYSLIEAQKKVFEETQKQTKEDSEICEMLYDIVSNIKDPEYNNTLEDLGIITPQNIRLSCMYNFFFKKTDLNNGKKLIKIIWTPTVPHCSYASHIGLAIMYFFMKKMFW